MVLVAVGTKAQSLQVQGLGRACSAAAGSQISAAALGHSLPNLE
tara:strand:- start:49 stop:180 length:132 start_codon:yes stop_codon:yes gene_type:complete